MRHRTERGGCRGLLLGAAAAMLLSTAVYAAEISVRNVSGALFADAGTHYELSVDGEGGTVTMDVQADGIPDGHSLYFRTSVVNSDGISSVFPTRSVLRNGEASPVSLELKPNLSGAELTGELLITFEYEDNATELPPRTAVVQITQRASAAAPPVPDNTEAELAIIQMLESTTRMPEVLFSDEAAVLTYRSADIVSWSSTSNDTEIVLRDVSALERDTPLVIDDYRPTVNGQMSATRYTVTLPSEQINYVLGRRADSIVSGLPSRITLTEDIARSDETHCYLVSNYTAGLPRGTTLFTDSTNFALPDERIMELTAETAWLASAGSRDMDVYLLLLYNGVSASQTVRLTLELSQPGLYPSVMLLNEGEQPDEPAAQPRPSETPATQPSEDGAQQTNRLVQSFDSRTNTFRQQLADGLYFTTSIPNGLVTNETVRLMFPPEIEYSIQLDDEPITYQSTGFIRPGCYRVNVSATVTSVPDTGIELSEITLDEIAEIRGMNLDELLDNSENTTLYTGEFSFRIVSGMTNSLVFYNPPLGYKISDVSYEGVRVSDYSAYSVRLRTDGRYMFTVSGAPGEPDFVTEIVRYTSAPQITLTGVENGMSTSDPVTITATAGNGTDTAQIEVQLDNSRITPSGNTVTAPGRYVVTATDSAGNTQTATFQIMYSVNVSGWVVVLITVTTLSALIGGMIYLRTHMRVR